MICFKCKEEIATAYVCGCGTFLCAACNTIFGCCGSVPAAIDHIALQGDLITTGRDFSDDDKLFEADTPIVRVEEVELIDDPIEPEYGGES